jgi:hypothetical protein
VVAIATAIGASRSAFAQTDLRSAQDFAVLGGSTVTNTGTSTVTGDLGVSPGTSVTGFPPGVLVGTLHAGDAAAAQAQIDASAAYAALVGDVCTTDLTGQDLGGLVLTPGVYCFTSSAQLTGTLTLDALGDPSAEFVLQIGTTLTTATSSSVTLAGGACAANVFWQVGTSATLGTSTTFVGNVLAYDSITATTGTNVSGRLLALTGAVTTDTNDVTRPPCDCDGKPGWHLGFDPPMPPIGGTVTFTLAGPADEMGLLMFSLGQGPIVTSYGTICLDFPLDYFEFFVFDSNGSATVVEDVPCDFNLRCLTFYSQFITCSPNKGVSNQVAVSIADAICTDGWMFSGTQSEWAGVSDGVGNLGYRRDSLFRTIDSTGVTIGDPNGLDGVINGYALHFTDAAALAAFLPQTGACGVLGADATDATTCSGGALAGELLAAKLNLNFDDGSGFADLKFRDDVLLGDLVFGSGVTTPFLGMSGRTLVGLADQVLSGALGAGPYDLDGDSVPDATATDVHDALVAFNAAFDGGVPTLNLVFP